MQTLEEAIVYVETVARANESLVSNYESDKIRAKIHRQLAAWLRELQETRKERDYWQEKANSYEQTIYKLTDAISKQPEIVRCGECVNFAERDFCKVAGHNVHRKSNCMQVFGAERRTE